MPRIAAKDCLPVTEGVDEFCPILVEKEVYLGCNIKIYRSFEGLYLYSTPYGRSQAIYYTIAEAMSLAREVVSRAICKGELPYKAPKKKKKKISYPEYLRRNRCDRRVEGR